MAVNGVGGYDYTTNVYGSAQNTAQAAAKETEVAKETETNKGTEIVDGFKKTGYKPDIDKIKSMKAQMTNNTNAFSKMVQGLVDKQGNFIGQAGGLKEFFANLQVDESTVLKAKEAISEDGEWGVNATSERILDFAKALSGGDPAKIESLRKAVQDGFKAAENAWGGKLPDITQQTYDKVMQGFDDWAKETQ